MCQNFLASLLKTQMCPNSSVSNFPDLSWSLVVHISQKFSDDAGATVGWETTPWEPLTCKLTLYDFSDFFLKCTLEFSAHLHQSYFLVLYLHVTLSEHLKFQLCSESHKWITETLERVWPWMDTIEPPHGFSGITIPHLNTRCMLTSKPQLHFQIILYVLTET